MPLAPTTGAVDLVLGLAAVVTLVSVVRSWRALWDADFTAADRRLATQAAVFLVPPVVVLVHELGHVAAVLAVGARVLELRYGLFEGAVAVGGRLTPAEGWSVALAGNVAGALAGLGLAAAGMAGRGLRRPLRHVLLVGGTLEVAFQLVGYPVLSLTARFGDWLSIYDFDATPGLSTATAVVHAAALWGLWRWWRGPVRQTLFAVDNGTTEELAGLRRAVREVPADADRWLELVGLYGRHGELGLTRATLERAVAGPAASPRLHLARARLALLEGRWNQAVLAAREGLRLAGGSDGEVSQRLWANLGLALASMERPAPALDAFDHVRPPVADDTRVRYGRGLARLAAGDVGGGRADLEAVVARLPQGDLLRQWAEARLDGRRPDAPDDSDRPNYQRRTRPPPAPIAGV